jgi:hypothetical protein
MKKYFKLLTLTLLLIILTGCSADYNVEINNYKEVEEYIYGEERNVIIEQSGVKEDVINSAINTLNIMEEISGYSKIPTYNTDTTSLKIYKKFNNINDYNNYSGLKSKFLGDVSILEDNNVVTINTKGYYYYQKIENNNIEIKNINIKLPFLVISNNADKVDKKNNIYTWELYKYPSGRTINIKYDSSTNYQDNVKKITNVNYLSNTSFFNIIIITIVVVIVGFLLFSLYKKNQENNKI